MSKGDYVDQILEELMDNPPDFCLCIGDDASDEGCYPRGKKFAAQVSWWSGRNQQLNGKTCVVLRRQAQNSIRPHLRGRRRPLAVAAAVALMAPCLWSLGLVEVPDAVTRFLILG